MITQATPAAFRKSYPLDVDLYNDEQQDVLYITDDPAGHNLHLDISNASGQSVLLSTTGTTSNAVASNTNYHFALRFRPGTLSPAFQSCLTFAVSSLQNATPAPLADATLQTFATETLTSLQAALQQQGWNVGYEQEPGGTTVLYFLSTQAQTLSPGAKVSMIFPHASAAGAGGARSTRVELRYQHVSMDNGVTLISGNRQSQLTVVNQRGQKHIPLHVSFVGANTILNDGKAQSTLTLRITNILKSASISLNSASSSAPSKFVFSFDVQADGATTDWALGTTSQVRAIKVETTDPGHWRVDPSSGQEQSPEWILMAQPSKPSLAPNEAVTLTISNIISSLPPGLTNLYIGYENIPGYWDGQFALSIEKTPLLYRGANVGIGTATPHGALEIGPDVTNANAWVYLQGNANGVANPSTEVRQGLMLTWNPSGGQGESQLLYGTRLGSTPRLDFGRWDGATKTIDMTLNGGNVGIGTTTPQNQLAVASQASFGGNGKNAGGEPIEVQGPGAGVSYLDRTGGATGRWVIYSDRTGGQGTETLRFWTGNDKVAITQAGNVGIGTDTPHTSLDVRGGDFQICVTNAQDHNWGFVNWTDDKLYFQYREQGVYKNNAMWLDQHGQLTLGSLAMGGNSLQQGVNWTAVYDGSVLKFAPLVSNNALRIVGGDGGVLAVNSGDVMCWAHYGIVVKGNIWAENKYFRIEHPTKLDSYLIHACLEGPESSVYYRGRAQLIDGRATIRLPAYFEALTRQEGRTVLLTSEGREPFLLSYEPIVDGTFRVYGTQHNGAFSWEVKAVRADVEEVEVEVTKDSATQRW